MASSSQMTSQSPSTTTNNINSTSSNSSVGINVNDNNIPPFIINPYLCQPLTYSKPLRWIDRVTTAYVPTMAFTYEITFYSKNPLGLNLRPQFIRYHNTKKFLGCCAVTDSVHNSPIYSIVNPGDILLKINDTSLIHVPDDHDQQQQQANNNENSENGNDQLFSFENITKTIISATIPRTIRFLRIASISNNLLPSPAEILLFMNDKTTSAKFTVGYGATESSSTSGSNAMTPQPIQLSWIDAQAPAFVKKMMNGQRVAWETPQPYQAISQLTSSSSAKSIHPVTQLEGIFKDKSKWYVIITNSKAQQQIIGKFDAEEEASNAYKRALEDVKKYGDYNPKRVKRQHRTALESQQQQQQQQQQQILNQQTATATAGYMGMYNNNSFPNQNAAAMMYRAGGMMPTSNPQTVTRPGIPK